MSLRPNRSTKIGPENVCKPSKLDIVDYHKSKVNSLNNRGGHIIWTKQIYKHLMLATLVLPRGYFAINYMYTRDYHKCSETRGDLNMGFVVCIKSHAKELEMPSRSTLPPVLLTHHVLVPSWLRRTTRSCMVRCHINLQHVSRSRRKLSGLSFHSRFTPKWQTCKMVMPAAITFGNYSSIARRHVADAVS